MRITKSMGHTALLFTYLFFGLNLTISKDLLDGAISPIGLNALRFSAGAIAFWLISLAKRERVANKDLLILFMGSLFGLLGNQILFIQGLSRTSIIDASIIATTVPIITMILSAVILKEPISWIKTLGVFVGASGAVFLVVSSQHDVSKSGDLLGDLLCFGSALSFSLFLVITKPVTQRYSSVTVMKWMFLFATIIIIPSSLSDLKAIDYSGLFSDNALSMGFVLIFATIIPYLLIPIGQKSLLPTTQAMYNYVLPIVAMGMAIYAGKNSLSVMKGLATALVFLGVYIVTRSKSRADLEVEKARLAERNKHTA